MNPFVRYELDPHQSPRELTEQLRERIEDTTSDEERNELRAAWELLTKKPTERVFLALEAGPDLRPRPTLRNAASSRKRTLPGIDILPSAFLVPVANESGGHALDDTTLTTLSARTSEKPRP